MRRAVCLLALCGLAAAQWEEAASATAVDEGLEQYRCPKAMCNTVLTFAQDTCVYWDSDENTYYLRSCSDRTDGRTYCSPHLYTSNVTCSAHYDPYIGSFPGGPCDHDYDCPGYGSCDMTTKRCKGVAVGGSCSYSGQCDPGSYCKESVCTNLLENGQECSDTFQCDYGLQCNKTYQEPGKCLEMYSLGYGEWVANCHSYESMFCQSGNCVPVGYSGSGYCVNPVTSVRTNPRKCSPNRLDCIGISGEETLTSRCNCGYNANGDSYCQPFYGDPEGEKYLAYTKDWMHSPEVKTCNIMMVTNYLCAIASGYKNADDYVWAQMLFFEYPRYQNNDACVKEILTRKYWEKGLELMLPILSLFILTA